MSVSDIFFYHFDLAKAFSLPQKLHLYAEQSHRPKAVARWGPTHMNLTFHSPQVRAYGRASRPLDRVQAPLIVALLPRYWCDWSITVKTGIAMIGQYEMN